MSFPSQDDPFLQAQADVLSTLGTTRSLYSSYLRIRSTSPSATSPELLDSRTELSTNLSDLSTDLQDLIDSVRAVEGDPFRYGLDIEEVGRRRKLVKDVGDEVDRIRDEISKGSQNQSRGVNGSLPLPPPEAFDDDDGEGGYEAFEQQQQAQIFHEQDSALDGVFKTVGNLRQQADDMGRELEEQEGMLGEVDVVADRVQGKLAGGIKRVGWVVRNSEDTWSSCCIGVLIFVLILLLVLVLIL